MRDQRPAVVIMAKAPQAGRAKSRLRGVLNDRETEALAGAFFADTLRAALLLDVDTIIAFAPSQGRDELERVVGGRQLTWIEQNRGDLGERLASVLARAGDLGFGPIVFLGTDSPNLPPRLVGEALTALQSNRADLVLGPAADGGCWLIGLLTQIEGLFDGVAWGSGTVLGRINANAEKLGLRIDLLQEWYDVDTPGDLLRLREDVARDPAAAPAAALWMAENGAALTRCAENTAAPAVQD